MDEPSTHSHGSRTACIVTLTTVVELPRAVAELLEKHELHPAELFHLQLTAVEKHGLDLAVWKALNIGWPAVNVGSFEKLDDNQSDKTTDRIIADLDVKLEHRGRVLALVDDLPWADVDDAIRAMEECLRLALHATRHALALWDDVAESNRFADEFSLTAGQIEKLSPEWRLAYAARLIKSLALNYGLADFEGARGAGGELGSETPAGILRGLNDIAWTPMTSDHDV
jgi:hypothetical protein